MSDKYYHPDTDFYRKLDVALPTADSHGTEEDIRKNLTPLKPYSWHLEGNQLIGLTDTGKFAQTIDPNYICKGIDSSGMPILEKIVVK